MMLMARKRYDRIRLVAARPISKANLLLVRQRLPHRPLQRMPQREPHDEQHDCRATAQAREAEPRKSQGHRDLQQAMLLMCALFFLIARMMEVGRCLAEENKGFV